MKQPIYAEFNLDAKAGIPQMIAVIHTDDRNADVLEVNVRQNGAHIDLTGAAVVARMVLHGDRDYLLNDSVPCTVSDSGNILIPFDNAVIPVQKGNIKIEVNLTQADSVFTLQFPLWVSVNGSILDEAELTPESKGTVPDLLKEAAEQLSRVKDFATEEFVFENLDAALQGKADKSAVEGRSPLIFTPHVGLVDSRNLSLYGTDALGNYHTSVPVAEGERYIISCRSSDSVYPGAFYTLNGTKVSSIFEDLATYLNVAITVPSGVDTLWINSKSTIIPLDDWKLYRIASAAEYTEHNNGCIVTLQKRREDEAVESLRRLKNLEALFDFRWKPFDKAYYCFVNDGTKAFIHVFYDVFHAHGMPLVAAAVGQNVELMNDTQTSGGRTVKQTLDAIVADGGEIMVYLNADELKSTDPFELWYEYAVKNGKHMLEAYGYTVRGLVLSAQSARNSAVGQQICERFFDYADNVGIKSQYDIERQQFSASSTVVDIKAYIDATVNTPGFYPIMFHRPSQEPWASAEGMDEILTYIESFGSQAAVSTYSHVFDTFGTNGFLTLGDLPVYNGGVV